MIRKDMIYSDGEPVWSKYFHTKSASRAIPTAGIFELTERCNFSCRMCYVHRSSRADSLSAADWIKLGEEAARCGMVFLLLTGGEPLIRDDFAEIYSSLRRLGLLVSVNTNGYLIDDALLELFRNEPPLRLNITLYGTSEDAYFRLCGVRGFERVRENIRRLREAGIQVRLNGSLTPYNCDDIPGLYRIAEQLGVTLKATSYMFPPVRVNNGGYGEAPHRFSPERAAEVQLLCREQYLTAEQLSSSSIIPSELDDCTDGSGDKIRCRAGQSSFWITHDGRMLPCGMFPWDSFSVREMGFESAWRAVHEACDSIRMPSKCTSCSLKDRCTACAAGCIAETGATDRVPEYICRMTKTLERLTAEKYPPAEKKEAPSDEA